MKNEHKKNLTAICISLVGLLFIVYYIFRASLDVVSSDYIRIINYYLKDVKDFSLMLSGEGIARIPFTFLMRYINKEFFGYSVFFDKILGAIGIFIFNIVVVKFVQNTLRDNKVRIITSIIVSIISFSLMSWEMILNGTGYPHFLTMAFVSIIFYLFDRIIKRTKEIMTLENIDSSDLKYYGNAENSNTFSNMMSLIDTSEMQRKNLNAHLLVYFLVSLTAICFAGSYAVGFLCTLILFSFIEILVFIKIRNKYNKGEIDSFGQDKELYKGFREQYNNQEIRSFGRFKGEKYSTVNNETTFKIFFKFMLLIIISLVCLALYLKSNATGEPLIPVGFNDITLIELMQKTPEFSIKFILKSLASAIIGVETFDYAINFKTINENIIFLFGLIYVLIILFTFIITIIRIVKKHNKSIDIFDIDTYRCLFPYMFIVYGIANFALVFLSRFPFLRDNYGMSSRYSIQYVFLTLGIIFLNAIFVDEVVADKKYLIIKKVGENLSRTYQKRREKLIKEGKIKLDKPKVSVFYVIFTVISIGMVSMLLLGHITTTLDEIFKADYRKIAYEKLYDMAKNYKEYDDETLMDAFEYRRGGDEIRKALAILKKQNLNIFRKRNR